MDASHLKNFCCRPTLLFWPLGVLGIFSVVRGRADHVWLMTVEEDSDRVMLLGLGQCNDSAMLAGGTKCSVWHLGLEEVLRLNSPCRSLSSEGLTLAWVYYWS